MNTFGTLTCLICCHSTDDLHDKLLVRAIDSVLQQTYRHFDILLVLDECWHKTYPLVFMTFNNPLRLHDIKCLFRTDKQGLAACKNWAMPEIKSDWIVMADADDEILPNKFEKQVHFLMANRDIDILSTHYWHRRISYMDRYNDPHFFPYDVSCWDNNEYLTHEQIVNKLPKENCLCGASVMMKRTIFDKIKYDESEEWRAKEDWKMWLDCMNAGYRFSQISNRLYIATLGSSVPR